MTQSDPLGILLVEDSDADIRLFQLALDGAAVASRLKVVSDGVEALAVVRRESPYVDVPRPDLIFLDLNMPRKDGRAVLAEIKSDPDLQTIPVVILTTSDADRDIQFCYRSHCNGYLIKPVQLDDFFRAVRTAVEYWNNIAIPTPKVSRKPMSAAAL